MFVQRREKGEQKSNIINKEITIYYEQLFEKITTYVKVNMFLRFRTDEWDPLLQKELC